jgi:general secretion pathway protein K
MREHGSGRPGQEGVALLIVLWAIGVLALISVVVTTTTRTEINRTRNLLESAKAEALADAGIYRAIAELLEADWSQPPLTDGTAYRWPFGDSEIVLSIQSEAGKIDLNAASDQLLRGLFISAEVEPEQAKRLVDAVRDFGDGNHARRDLGAEDDDYHTAGMINGAKDARFENVSELQQVMGMTPELFERVAPVMTVYSGAKNIDRETAPRMALLALAGATPERVDAMLASRATDSADHALSAFDADAESAFDADADSEDLIDGLEAVEEQEVYSEAADPDVSRRRYGVFTITAAAQTPGGGSFERVAVVRLKNDSKSPFTIHEWRQRWPSSERAR